MNAYTTALATEVYFHVNNIWLMGAVTTGTLDPDIASFNSNGSVYSKNNQLEQLGFYWKLAYDKTINDDFRFRVALSGYNCKKNNEGSLYSGDRSGSRFYLVMAHENDNPNDVDISENAWSGRWAPGFNLAANGIGFTDKDNSYMLNLFLKHKGLELFGTLESAKGTTAFTSENFNFTQYEFNSQYYFGKDENVYVGGKINGVDNHEGQKVFRFEGVIGWFLTKNIIVKAEYVNQKYKGFSFYGDNAGFKGMMFESGISF